MPGDSWSLKSGKWQKMPPRSSLILGSLQNRGSCASRNKRSEISELTLLWPATSLSSLSFRYTQAMKILAPLLAVAVAGFSLSACDAENEAPAASTGTLGPGAQGSAAGQPGGDVSRPNNGKVTRPFCRDRVEILSGIDAPLEGTDLRALVERVSTRIEGTWKGDTNAGTQGPVKVEIHPSVDGEAGFAEIRYGSGQVRLVRKEFVGCSPGGACADIAVRCIDQIEIDLELKVGSTSGAFFENLVASVSIADPRDPDGHGPVEDLGQASEERSSMINVKSTVEPGSFQGSASIRVSPTDPASHVSAHRLQFVCRFETGKAPRASISSFVEVNTGTMMGAGVLPLYELEPAPN